MKVWSVSSSWSWWRPLSPIKALVSLLALSLREMVAVQGAPLAGRCVQGGQCCIALDEIEQIRNAVFPIPRPWEEEQCVPLKRREHQIQEALEGVRERMALGTTPFGPKHDHLDQMADFLIDFLQVKEWVVTRPRGFELKALNVSPLWEQACQVRPLDLPSPRVQEILAKIEKEILELPFSFPPELQRWFETFEGLIIARSSGPEDKNKKTNAGGNLSKIMRGSEANQTTRAVVASYTGKFSLKNRVDSGEDPCEEELSYGLFFQPYKQGNASFVHFSGSPSVTSSTFGDGTGVVGTGTPVDTHHCLPSYANPDRLYCHDHVAEKPEKWGVGEKGELVRIANPNPLAASLTSMQVELLYVIGLVLKYFFGYEEVDIEGLAPLELVQVRPLSAEFPPSNYLDLEVPGALFVDPIVAANNSVIAIDCKEEILFAANWQEAWRHYKPGVHKVAITPEEASSTSHYALSFKKRIPCFRTEELEAIQKMSFPLGICTQTGRFFPWKDSYQSFVREGEAVHRARIIPSLGTPYPFLKKLSAAPRALRLLLRQLPRQPALFAQLREFFEPFFREKERLEGEVERLPFCPAAIRERREALVKFGAIVEEALEEVRVCLEQSGEELLFFLKVLEQTARIDCEHLLSSLRELIDYQNQLSHPAQFADLLPLGNEVPSEKAAYAWKQSLLHAEANALPRSEITSFIHLLKKSGSLPSWLLFFQPRNGTLENVAAQIGPSDRTLLTDLLHTDPLAPSFLRQIQNASPIARLSAYALLRKSVETLDGRLKELLDSDHPNLAHFEERVRDFLQLVRSWVKELVPQGALPKRKDGWSLEDPLAQEIAFPPMEPTQLLPSSNFHVAAALFGASVPESWHDWWTFFHQILLSILGRLNELALPKEQIETSFLPEEMKRAMSTIEQTDWGREISRVSIEVGEEVVVIYNVPLGQHSLLLELRQGILTVKFLGLGGDRDTKISAWVQALQGAGIFQWEEFVSSPEEFTFSCKEMEKIGSLLKECIAIAEFTFGKDFSEVVLNLLERWEEYRLPLGNYFLSLAEADIEGGEILRGRAVGIWKALFKVGYQKNALEVVETSWESKNRGLVQQVAFPLSEGLIQQGVFYERATEIAQTFAASKDVGIQQTIFQLWIALVEKGQSYLEAVQAAERGIENYDPSVHYTIFQLWIALIKKGQSYPEAIRAAEKGIKSDDWRARRAACELWEALLKKGQGIQTAFNVVRARSTFSEASLNLLRFLVEQGQGFPMAIRTAQTEIEDENPQIRTTAFALWKALFEKGWGYEEGMQTAKKLLEQYIHPPMKMLGLNLLKELVSRGYGYKEAEEQAKANIHDPYLQKLCSDLLKLV